MPQAMGHEYCGFVEEVGSAVKTVKPGQFVIGSFCISDNTCPNCRAGYQSGCQQLEFMTGAQAPYPRVSVATVDVSSCDAVRALVAYATGRGEITVLIHAAGVSPSQAYVATILKVDLYGTALVLEEFGNVVARGGAGVVIASQSGHRLPPLTVEQNKALATTPTEELLKLAFLLLDKVTDSLHAYQLSKRGNSLRVMAEAVRWGKRGARINTISPGIIITPLAKDELTGPRGAGYRRMIELAPAKRGRHSRRGGNCRRVAYGAGRRVHHRQRLPHGWRSNVLLLERRARATVVERRRKWILRE